MENDQAGAQPTEAEGPLATAVAESVPLPALGEAVHVQRLIVADPLVVLEPGMDAEGELRRLRRRLERFPAYLGPRRDECGEYPAPDWTYWFDRPSIDLIADGIPLLLNHDPSVAADAPYFSRRWCEANSQSSEARVADLITSHALAEAQRRRMPCIGPDWERSCIFRLMLRPRAFVDFAAQHRSLTLPEGCRGEARARGWLEPIKRTEPRGQAEHVHPPRGGSPPENPARDRVIREHLERYTEGEWGTGRASKKACAAAAAHLLRMKLETVQRIMRGRQWKPGSDGGE
jgi:hypothetical protein